MYQFESGHSDLFLKVDAPKKQKKSLKNTLKKLPFSKIKGIMSEILLKLNFVVIGVFKDFTKLMS